MNEENFESYSDLDLVYLLVLGHINLDESKAIKKELRKRNVDISRENLQKILLDD